jgi:hypothetical protein
MTLTMRVLSVLSLHSKVLPVYVALLIQTDTTHTTDRQTMHESFHHITTHNTDRA